jgi:ADP-ribose pyrophosphatase
MILGMRGPVQSETTHRGRLLTVEVLSFDAAAGDRVEREVVHHPGAVVILPVLDDDRVVLIRNDRIAVGQTLWELPAGTLEPGEDPAAAAARELGEETGYRPARVRPLTSFYTSPGFLDERLYAFVAEGLVDEGQRLEPGEDIEVRTLTVGEVLAMIDDGRIEDGKTIAVVLAWWRRERAEGRSP